ncbi:MAG: hypothetical protein B0D91_05880 [Oceanospirillales bacterium LUC14_002_19_P2]|nr:MAG: hypothetical protein B0D91_05880 [Oceanospirillales bacterium LUC14_002_19_P2]
MRVACLRWTSAVMLALVTQLASAYEPVSYDDPLEPMNRKIFHFNEKMDQWILDPAARGYDKVTPEPVQGLVTSFFQNLGEVRNLVNAVLQLRMGDAAATSGRFVINSTIGMLGMLDVATELGIERRYQDFGLTLARWHVPSGPYVVLPFYGPRTARSTVGFVPDLELNPTNSLEWWSPEFMAIHTLDILDTRNRLRGAEGLIVGDKYIFIRDAYLQSRQFMITGEVPEDDF